MPSQQIWQTCLKLKLAGEKLLTKRLYRLRLDNCTASDVTNFYSHVISSKVGSCWWGASWSICRTDDSIADNIVRVTWGQRNGDSVSTGSSISCAGTPGTEISMYLYIVCCHRAYLLVWYMYLSFWWIGIFRRDIEISASSFLIRYSITTQTVKNQLGVSHFLVVWSYYCSLSQYWVSASQY